MSWKKVSQKLPDQAGPGPQVTVPPRPLAAEDLLPGARGGRGGGWPELLGPKHLELQPQGSPLAGSPQTQRAAVGMLPTLRPALRSCSQSAEPVPGTRWHS